MGLELWWFQYADEYERGPSCVYTLQDGQKLDLGNVTGLRGSTPALELEENGDLYVQYE